MALVHSEVFKTRSAAMSREYELKTTAESAGAYWTATNIEE